MTPEVCLAIALFFEARSESIDSQKLIGEVIIQRVADDRWPDDVCGVVFQGESKKNACQFSFACDGLSDKPSSVFKGDGIEEAAWETSKKVASEVMSKEELFNTGADHYHTVDVSPSWSKKMTLVGKKGDHLFYISNSW